MVGNDSSPHLKMFGELFQTCKCRNERDIDNSAKVQNIYIYRPNFWKCLDKNIIRQNEKQGLIFVKKFQARTEAARPEEPRSGVGSWGGGS